MVFQQHDATVVRDGESIHDHTDYLGSQQNTPRASTFPANVMQSRDMAPIADSMDPNLPLGIAHLEQNHDVLPSEEHLGNLPALPESRTESVHDSDIQLDDEEGLKSIPAMVHASTDDKEKHSRVFDERSQRDETSHDLGQIATVTALTGAALLAGHEIFKDDKEEKPSDPEDFSQSTSRDVPQTQSVEEDIPRSDPLLARASSKSSKKTKKGKKKGKSTSEEASGTSTPMFENDEPLSRSITEEPSQAAEQYNEVFKEPEPAMESSAREVEDVASTGKKKKKGKKRDQAIDTWADEPAEAEPSEARDLPPTHEQTTSLPENLHGHLPVAEEAPPTVEDSAFEQWPTSSKQKKKAKKNRGIVDLEEPPFAEDTSRAAEELVTDVVEDPTPALAEPADEWASLNKNKKSKKNRKVLDLSEDDSSSAPVAKGRSITCRGVCRQRRASR